MSERSRVGRMTLLSLYFHMLNYLLYVVAVYLLLDIEMGLPMGPTTSF